MPLSSGTLLGPYEIAEQIGSGGMGEVYRARDKTLERDVALKVLPASVAADTDRIARFEQEAKTLAALNHANIAQIYGLESGAETAALVMELVEGPTLADRLEQGPLPPDDAIHVAMQVAGALEAAHARGIVHRDLKPANIKLKADGTVKVLDFGIAKAFSPEGSTTGPQSPVMTTPVTQAGVLLGTAAYMSPEQARAKPVDPRTDIWAFGCVLYEMLTGQPAFAGEDVTTTLARVVERDVDMSALPRTVSRHIRQALHLCLQKDPGERLHSIGDVRLALEGALDRAVAESAGGSGSAAPPHRKGALPVATGAFALGAALVGLVAWNLAPESQTAPRTVDRFRYSLPTNQLLRNPNVRVLALSPDGRRFVYNTSQGLYLRDFGALDAQPIPGTEAPLGHPFFSSDGRSIAYVQQGALTRIAVTGGAPVVIAEGIVNTAGFPDMDGASWTDAGTILFGRREGISRVSAAGGEPELVIEAREGERLASPWLLPDGETVLFSSLVDSNDWDEARIVAQSLTTDERVILARGGADARYLPSGHLVYALGNTLRGVAFDPESLTVSGGAVPLVEGVARSSLDRGHAHYDVADNGTLIYASGSLTPRDSNAYVWVDSNGNEERLGIRVCFCAEPALSPDGTRVAVTLVEDGGGSNIWIRSLERRTTSRLTFRTSGLYRLPVWSPDGERIAYSAPDGIYARTADGTGAPELLLEGVALSPWAWTRDGRIVFRRGEDPENGNVGVFSVADGASEAEMLLTTEFNESKPALSPDGRWLAYESDETGRREIFVRPFPDVDAGKWAVSADGGEEPKWAADGRTLLYAGPTQMMSVRVAEGPAFEHGAPEAVLDHGGYLIGVGAVPPRNYDVSRDGERLLMVKQLASTADERQIIIVRNWVQEVKRLVPAGSPP